MKQRILIIGGGIAGVSAAEAARSQDSEAEIILFTQDTHLPYYRLRICEVLDDPTVADQLLLHQADWYEKQAIEVRTGQTVADIDPARRQICLANGSRESYTSLVVCSGSQSFVPPVKGIGRPGVHTLWTLQDALDLSVELTQARKVIVIGGGLLGLEVAYHTRRAGLETRIIEKLPRLLANQLDEQGSEVFCQRVCNLDISVETSADVVDLYGRTDLSDSPVAGIRLADGRIFEADLVLISIGVRANIGFLDGSGLAVQRRIITDAYMQTSAPGVYAAGDAAEPEQYWFGLWSVSRTQGQVAGINAAGGRREFDRTVPPYVINTMETKVAVQGDKGLLAEPEYELDVLLDPESGNYRKLVYRDGLFSGFILIGDTRDFARLQKSIGQPAG